MPTPRRVPWFAVDVDIRINEKLVSLPNDSARYGWIAAVLAEGKRASRPGQFRNRAHLAESIGRYGRHIADYITAGLLEESPKVCDRCRDAFGDLEGGRLVIHDWWRKQRDPDHAERQERYRTRRERETDSDDAVTDSNVTIETSRDESVQSILARARRTTETETETEPPKSGSTNTDGAANIEDAAAALRVHGYRRVTAKQRALLADIADREGWTAVVAWIRSTPDGTDPIDHVKVVMSGNRTRRTAAADKRVADHERTKRSDPGPLATKLAEGLAPPRPMNGHADRTTTIAKFAALRGSIPDEALARQLAGHGLTLDDLEGATT